MQCCVASYTPATGATGTGCCCDPRQTKKNLRILIGVTDSAAANILPELVEKLCSMPNIREVAVIVTEKSEQFFNAEEVNTITSVEGKAGTNIWRDDDEWNMGVAQPEEPALHAKLGKWADTIIVAPLDAKTLAKLAHGVCDNLLTCVLRNWDLCNIQSKPVFFCPAIHPQMWQHSVTTEQIDMLETFGYVCIRPPDNTGVTCGDTTGTGEMASVDRIVDIFRNHINNLCACRDNCDEETKGSPEWESDSSKDKLLRTFMEMRVAKLMEVLEICRTFREDENEKENISRMESKNKTGTRNTNLHVRTQTISPSGSRLLTPVETKTISPRPVTPVATQVPFSGKGKNIVRAPVREDYDSIDHIEPEPSDIREFAKNIREPNRTSSKNGSMHAGYPWKSRTPSRLDQVNEIMDKYKHLLTDESKAEPYHRVTPPPNQATENESNDDEDDDSDTDPSL